MVLASFRVSVRSVNERPEQIKIRLLRRGELPGGSCEKCSFLLEGNMRVDLTVSLCDDYENQVASDDQESTMDLRERGSDDRRLGHWWRGRRVSVVRDTLERTKKVDGCVGFMGRWATTPLRQSLLRGSMCEYVERVRLLYDTPKTRLHSLSILDERRLRSRPRSLL
jgi:hypothetical protein